MELPERHCPACGTEVQSLGSASFLDLVELKKIIDSPGWRVLLSHIRSEHLGAVERLLAGGPNDTEKLLATAQVSHEALTGLHELPTIVDKLLDQFEPEANQPEPDQRR